jgi:hypothetical protein
MADVIGGHDESTVLRKGCHEDHLHLAGDGKEEAAAANHYPMKGGSEKANGKRPAGVLSGSEGRHEERNMEIRKSGRVRLDVSAF